MAPALLDLEQPVVRGVIVAHDPVGNIGSFRWKNGISVVESEIRGFSWGFSDEEVVAVSSKRRFDKEFAMDARILESMLPLGEMRITDVVVEQEAKVLNITLEWRDEACSCPKCGMGAALRKREGRKEPVRHLNCFEYRTLLYFDSMEMECRDGCGAMFNRKPSFMGEAKFISRLYFEDMIEKSTGTSLSQVAAWNDVAVSTFTDMYFSHLKSIDARRELRQVDRLGIDEVSLLKGRANFVLVLYDIDRREVLDLLPNRLKATLVDYLKTHRDSVFANLKSVCIDMWTPYREAVKEVFPGVGLVVDRFHVIKHLNECLDDCRRDIARKIKDTEERKKWKQQSRPILFRDLNEQLSRPNGEAELCEILGRDPSNELNRLYFLREEFRHIYEIECPEVAQRELKNWIRRAKHLNSEYLNPFIRTVKKWKKEILSFVVHQITNGLAEGFNNKIKLVKRIGYGIRNFVNFRLRILHTCCKSFCEGALQ